MREINDTHNPRHRSWVASANVVGADFPIQNLPHGVFRDTLAGGEARGGIAIGDQVLDLVAAIRTGWFQGKVAAAAEAASQPTLNAFMAMGKAASGPLRDAVSALLNEANPNNARLRDQSGLLLSQAAVEMQVPCRIDNYTDFLTSVHHTERNGRLKGLAVPLPPAFKSLPVAYHGRASSIRIHGTPVRRPNGQWKGEHGVAEFGAVRCMDFELELAAFVSQGNALGEPIPVEDAGDHIFGYCLLNDWSAKDVQWWEQVLGPFLGKSFMSTVSPWVVTCEALAPFQVAHLPRPEGDPAPLPHLAPAGAEMTGCLDLDLTAAIRTAGMRASGQPFLTISRSNTRHMYWSFGQMLTHHASNGCNLLPGDLMGSGTVSGPEPGERACMTELTSAGATPIAIGNERRGWLEDGDEIVLQARAQAPGRVGIGFGPCSGRIEQAVKWPIYSQV